jgi:predicted secreted protein
MDLYLFYNGINNLIDIYNVPEDKVSIKHTYLFNDPLLLSQYVNTKLFTCTTINTDEQYGGAKKKKKGNSAEKNAAEAEKKRIKAGLKEQKAAAKGASEKVSSADVDSTLKESEDEDEMAQFKKIIKQFMKIIIGIIIVICIPIVPWVLISFYAFKSLGNFIEINMNRL